MSGHRRGSGGCSEEREGGRRDEQGRKMVVVERVHCTDDASLRVTVTIERIGKIDSIYFTLH